jgi:aminoglycoside phosphotransferase (APT) family kinase protein
MNGAMDVADMQERLARFIAQQVGVESVRVDNLRRLPGGASRETWSVDVAYDKSGDRVTLPLVLRRDPPSSGVQTLRREEFLLLRAAHDEGVPVPAVHWLADEAETLDAAFFLMDRIEGETLARRLLRDEAYAPAREVMTGQLGAILARIHAIDRKERGIDFLPECDADESPARGELHRYQQIFSFAAADPHPVVDLAFRWLRSHMPPAGRRVIVHGDFRIGNVIFGPEGVRSILDWELAHVGDAMEDLGWLCVRAWRFGNDAKPVGGIGNREELFAAYEKAASVRVDPAHVHFLEVYGNRKWAIICMTQAKTYLDGHVKSVELASLGRRTAETELELLNLLDGTPPA